MHTVYRVSCSQYLRLFFLFSMLCVPLMILYYCRCICATPLPSSLYGASALLEDRLFRRALSSTYPNCRVRSYGKKHLRSTRIA